MRDAGWPWAVRPEPRGYQPNRRPRAPMRGKDAAAAAAGRRSSWSVRKPWRPVSAGRCPMSVWCGDIRSSADNPQHRRPVLAGLTMACPPKLIERRRKVEAGRFGRRWVGTSPPILVSWCHGGSPVRVPDAGTGPDSHHQVQIKPLQTTFGHQAWVQYSWQLGCGQLGSVYHAKTLGRRIRPARKKGLLTKHWFSKMSFGRVLDLAISDFKANHENYVRIFEEN